MNHRLLHTHQGNDIEEPSGIKLQEGAYVRVGGLVSGVMSVSVCQDDRVYLHTIIYLVTVRHTAWCTTVNTYPTTT